MNPGPQRSQVYAWEGFEAARQLPAPHPYAGRWHGHSFRIGMAMPAEQLAPAFAGDEEASVSAQLADVSSQFDYCNLNDRLAQPDDIHLLQALVERLPVPPAVAALRSAPETGVMRDQDGRFLTWLASRFEAAHQLPNVPDGHPCGRLHGHGFVVRLYIETASSSRAATQLAALRQAWSELWVLLDHGHLNLLPGLENPTSEMLCVWIWQRLQQQVAGLRWVQVRETATAGCLYDGEDFRIWKAQRFEAARRLPAAPATDRRHNWHGHSYLIRLHLCAPLDPVLGWTLDFGDVKALFTPVYQQLDHYDLNRIAALQSGCSLSLANWISEQIGAELPQLQRVDVQTTPQSGCQLTWDDVSAPSDLPTEVLGS